MCIKLWYATILTLLHSTSHVPTIINCVGPALRTKFYFEFKIFFTKGILGDCWLLSTCAALAKKEELLHRVLPPNQYLFGPNYNGSINLKIWQFGHWHDIIIDDRLPLINGKYIYGHCADPTEFWVALIEKAFAKV